MYNWLTWWEFGYWSCKQYFVHWFLPFLVFVLAGRSRWHDNPKICNVSCWQAEVANMMTPRFAMFLVSGAKSPTQWHEVWLRDVADKSKWVEMKIFNVSWRWGKFAVTMICNVLCHHVDFAQRHEDLANIHHVGDFAPPTHNKCKSLCHCVTDQKSTTIQSSYNL